MGESKKDAEERAAQLALSNLQESKIISPSGKLMFGVQIPQTGKESAQQPYTFGPIPTEDYQPSIAGKSLANSSKN